MSVIETVLIILIILGMMILGWLLIAGVIWFYGWLEKKSLKKRIPEKIRKEVEDGRIKTETELKRAGQLHQKSSGAEPAVERDSRNLSDQRDIGESDEVQRMADVRSSETEGRSQYDNRFPQRKLRRI